MRWPALVPRALCKTPIQVTLRREGIDEDGAPVAALTVELRTLPAPLFKKLKAVSPSLFQSMVMVEIQFSSSGNFTSSSVIQELIFPI